VRIIGHTNAKFSTLLENLHTVVRFLWNPDYYKRACVLCEGKRWGMKDERSLQLNHAYLASIIQSQLMLPSEVYILLPPLRPAVGPLAPWIASLTCTVPTPVIKILPSVTIQTWHSWTFWPVSEFILIARVPIT